MIRIVLIVLFLLAAPAQSWAQREIPVTVVTDEVFEQWPQWRGLVKSVMREAARDFPELVGWRLVIKNWESVEPGPHDSYTPALKEMSELIEFKNGVLVYFAGRQYVKENRRGFALLDSRALAVSLDRKPEMIITLRHELGHMMGLPHCPGKNVMAEAPLKRTWEFTPLAREALKAVRGMALGHAPLFFGADLAVLQEVHGAWREAGYGDDRVYSRLEDHFKPKPTKP